MTIHSFSHWFSQQRSLPYKFRRSVLKKLNPSMLRNYPFEADLLGLRFRGNIVNYIDRLIYFCGAYEKHMLFFLRDVIRKWQRNDLVFVDVGANVGNHSLYLATLVDRVISFEPFERVRTQLLENIKLNNLHNITLLSYGLSNDNAILPFYAPAENNLGASSFHADYATDKAYVGEMQVRVGDEVMAELAVDNIDILKVDVEGFEKYVLMGLSKNINASRPIVIIELSPSTRRTLSGEAEFRTLFPRDYRFYFFSEGRHDSGRYKLAVFDYALSPKIQDVIAVPEELANLI